VTEGRCVAAGPERVAGPSVGSGGPATGGDAGTGTNDGAMRDAPHLGAGEPDERRGGARRGTPRRKHSAVGNFAPAGRAGTPREIQRTRVSASAITTSPSSTAPELTRSRDLRGRAHQPWVRRVVLLLIAALLIVALSGRLGQSDRVSTAETATARIDLRTPSTLRGGLLWPARVTVRARTRIVDPELTLGAGYVRGMQLNAIEPAAQDEASRGDSVTLTYPTLDAGDQLTVYLQLQVNPDTLGRQDLSVALRGGGDDPPPPVHLPASATVLP
jgi:hypothetical protein